MKFEIKLEFNKIKKAFLKFKKDIENLKTEIENLKKNNSNENKKINSSNEIEKLKEEIKFLKKVIYSIQTKEEIKIQEEKREIIGDKLSLKFHYSTCPFTKRISPENMIVFATIEDAKKKGYFPCHCINKIN